MLGWLKTLGKGGGGEWRRAPFPEKELEWLYLDFLPLEALDPGIAEDTVLHIALGGNAGVLTRLGAIIDAGMLMGLRAESHACEGRTPEERDAFFASTTIMDAAFHLRLAQAYEAALKSSEKRRASPGMPGGTEWLEIYLWEATRAVWGPKATELYETRVHAQTLEDMLKLSGHATTWLARGALHSEPKKARGQSPMLAELLLRVPEIASSFTAHPETVSECLGKADHRNKARLIDVLHRAGVSASLLPEQAATLAVSSAKGVREAAAAWILQTPEPILPELQKLAVQGEPDERLHAVTLLGAAGHGLVTPFLMERLTRDKAKKVVRVIETLLGGRIQS